MALPLALQQQVGVMDSRTHPVQGALNQYVSELQAMRPQYQNPGAMIGSVLLPALVAGLAGGDLGESLALGAGGAAQEYQRIREGQKATDMAIATAKQGGPQAIADYNKTQADILNTLAPDTITPSNAAKMATELGLVPGTPEYNQFIRDYAFKPPSQTDVQVNLPGEGVPATNAVMTQLQKDLMTQYGQGMKLRSIGENYQPSFLTYQQKGKNWLTAMQEKVGMEADPEAQQALAEWEEFQIDVEQLFNEYRRLVTGAAASEKELENLRKTYLNTDISKTQFESRYNRLVDEMEKKSAMASILMGSGFVAGPQLESMVDAAYRRGREPWQLRADILEREGLSDDEVLQQLISEGWVEAQMQ